MMDLQEIYNTHVKVDELVQKRHSVVINEIINNVILKMRRKDPLLDAIFSDIYHTGSRWDGLQVGTDRQECDINMCFRIKEDVVVELGQHGHGRGGYQDKPNFGFLKLLQHPSSEVREICKYNDYLHMWTISPGKLFERLQSAGDATLDEEYTTPENDGEPLARFKVTRQVKSPWTLHVEPLDTKRYNIIDIDICPAIRLPFDSLKDEKLLKNIRGVWGKVVQPPSEFMAISLYAKDKERFKIDFHEAERGLLKKKGCAKIVIRLMKYFRNVTGGPFVHIPSHLIKTSVMHVVLDNKDSFWDGTLEECFTKCMLNLAHGFEIKQVTDIFFENDDMVTSKIEIDQIINEINCIFVGIKKKLEKEDAASLFNFEEKWMKPVDGSYLVGVYTDGNTYTRMKKTQASYIIRNESIAEFKGGVLAMLYILANHIYNVFKFNPDVTSEQIKDSVQNQVDKMDGDGQRNWRPSNDVHDNKLVTLGVPLNDPQKRMVLVSFDLQTGSYRKI